MKIAVIGSKGLPPKQGGIEHYCAEVYPRIISRGHLVDLFARSSYTGLSWYSDSNSSYFDGVRVISLPGTGLRGVDALVSSALGATIASFREYDIIHFHALGPALFSFLPRFASHSKVVVTCQGLDWQRAKWGNLSSRIILQGEKTAVRYAHEIVVVSEALQQYFWETYRRETIYIPNAPASYVDSDPDYGYVKSLGLSKGKYVVFLGRLVPEKRPDLLVRAFKSLQQEDWKLVLVGGTSDTPSYRSELLGLAESDPSIIFAGEHRGKHLAEIVRGAGLFVLPSALEGLPLAMLEAMSQGIPVMASDIPPHRQLLENGHGMLFEADNVTACATAMKWAFSNVDEMQRMSERASRHVRLNYNWEQVTAQNLHLYERLCDVPAPQPVGRG